MDASKGGRSWFTPLMATASQAIIERFPLVDYILEIRDSRVPFSSKYQNSQHIPSKSRHLVVLNKKDLASPSQTQNWMRHFEGQNYNCCGLNAHNKDDITKLLNFIQAQVSKMNVDRSKPTATIMVVGIPNVGKSAIVNSLHQIGRISSTEKGKLKHTIVSPHPGETKDIGSFKIASKPNIFVLDTPGVLVPEVLNIEMCSNLALTGAIEDSLAGEYQIAKYFLAILNSSEEYRHWKNLKAQEDNNGPSQNHLLGRDSDSAEPGRKKRQYPTDHTQDFIVKDVRRVLYNTISTFQGNLEHESQMMRLIESQLLALLEAFRIPPDSGNDKLHRVSTKLINLYRTGRLGHYTLETPLPTRDQHTIVI
ncbi:hypothetical protein AMTR_s00149p00069080 [Amborella trichopoda]|uniref:G domain-containing protein n=2 Tax=Amborella trichopoda TaxID=13333 RepID=W1PMK9_AMBTC|nr:hypothetical protein AMTR_s00149p00069080 [Amborella trichopoda]